MSIPPFTKEWCTNMAKLEGDSEIGVGSLRYRYNKIDPEFKAKWLEALRSGKYTQARHKLVEIEGSYFNNTAKIIGHCCVAVGGKVAEVRLDDIARHLDGKQATDLVAEGIGLDRIVRDELVRLNDSQLANFREIAEWIEVNL